MHDTISHERNVDRLIDDATDEREDRTEVERSATRAAVRALGAEQKERLLEIALQIVESDNSVFDDRRLAGRFVNVVLDSMDATKGGVFSRDASGSLVTLSARHGSSSVGVDSFSRTQILEALSTGRTIKPPTEGYSAVAAPSIRANMPGPSIVVPIMAPAGHTGSGRPFGAMCLVRNEGEATFDDDESFLELVAKVVSPLLHRSQIYQVAINELHKVEVERNTLQTKNEELRQELLRRDESEIALGIVGLRSRPIRRCMDRAKVAASSKSAPVIILGETGSGKEKVARAVHGLSSRKEGLFKAVNCAALAIDGNTLNSELFGHVKGAFTGADTDRAGVFRVAEGGTVFLDEVTELTREAQAKLLRVLQERVVTPLGGDRDVPVDVRVVVATNRDLEADVAKGRFRDDLYSRLKVVTINIPPLRERRDDIPELALHFLNKWAAEEGIEEPQGLTREALATLREYPWPDNVRGLENVMRQVLLFTRGRKITGDDVAGALDPKAVSPERKQWTKARMVDLLEVHDWNVTKARKSAGVSKTHMYYLMEKLGVERPGGDLERAANE